MVPIDQAMEAPLAQELDPGSTTASLMGLHPEDSGQYSCSPHPSGPCSPSSSSDYYSFGESLLDSLDERHVEAGDSAPVLAKCLSEGPHGNDEGHGPGRDLSSHGLRDLRFPSTEPTALVRSNSGTPVVTPRHTEGALSSYPASFTRQDADLAIPSEEALMEGFCEHLKGHLVREGLLPQEASLEFLISKSSVLRMSAPGLMGPQAQTVQPKPHQQRIPGCNIWRAPSQEELRSALPLLDMNRDGKVWEQDLDMLVQLAFGVDVDSALASWHDLKHALQSQDGLISLGPLGTATDLGLVHREAEKMRPIRAQSLGGRPTITWGPFVGLCNYLEIFNRFDRDKNGVICARDLKMACCLLVGMSISQAECKEMIRKVDINNNGVVDLLEFGALVELLTSSIPEFRALMHVLTADLSRVGFATLAKLLSLDVTELEVLMRTAMADVVEVFLALQESSKMAATGPG